MRKLICLALAALLALPVTAFAASTSASSEEAMMQQLQKQIQDLSEELEDLTTRLEKNERHTALDRIEFSGDMRHKFDSLHYSDVTFNPGVLVNFDKSFDTISSYYFGQPMAGAAQGSISAAQDMVEGFLANPPVDVSALQDALTRYPGLDEAFLGYLAYPSGALGNQFYPMIKMPKTYDINNDVLQTSRMRLNMKARVWDNVKFSGRLTMYKNWGDSTNSKVFDSWNSFTMDGTNTGNTTGDLLHVDRAFFDWSDIGGTGIYLSIGRRPSTYGPPTEFRENELRGGTPTGNVMNLNFDGITIGKHLEEQTGIPGFTARFCYGQGYESEWGNGELFNNIQTKDTHFAGFNFDLYNDGKNFLQTTLFRAQDINDGFKGIIAFPTEFGELFAPTLYSDMQKFPTFNFVTRVQPSTTIGDINLGGIVFSRQEDNGINWFVAGGWTQLRPNGKAGMFGGMGTDAVFEATFSDDGSEIYMKPATATESKVRDGYGLYVGVQIPAPMGKVGFEYNYGSKYYTPFTQVQDDVIGSKLATRGQVGEAYYIVEVNPRMFLKFGGLYYDYEYTNSGSPVGAPQKVEDVQNGTAYSLLPVIDKAYDLNASITLKF